MSRACGTAVALALVGALVTAGCGLGPGDSEGTVELSVTRDYGAETLVRADPEVRESDTVLRLLDRSADVSTRYGGRFVQSIDGLAGGQTDGRLYDWFYYVNGIEAPRGSAEFDLAGGDRVWWDYRDWTEAMRVPAVVGAWPEPFVHGFDGERWPVSVECVRAAGACSEVRNRLEDAGAELAAGDGAGDDGQRQGSDQVVRVLVGPWEAIRGDPVARLVERDPARSGVFADFALGAPEGWLLTVEDASGAGVRSLGPAAGLVAALRPADGPPTWLVTGTDLGGVDGAANALDSDTLRNRYAVAIAPGGRALRLPAEGTR